MEKPDKYSHLNDLEFFKKWIEDNIKSAYRAGKVMIAQETTPPDIIEDIVEVI